MISTSYLQYLQGYNNTAEKPAQWQDYTHKLPI